MLCYVTTHDITSHKMTKQDMTFKNFNMTFNVFNVNYLINFNIQNIIFFIIIGPVIMLVMFFVKRYKIPETDSPTTDEKNNVVLVDDPHATQIPLEQSPRTRKVLIVLFALMLNSYGFENIYFLTVATYLQYLPNVVISASKAAEIMITLSITYTVGRLISAFIAAKVRAEVMITYHMVIIAISIVILYIGQSASTITLVYIGNGLIGKFTIAL